jgi:hypothetical protein
LFLLYHLLKTLIKKKLILLLFIIFILQEKHVKITLKFSLKKIIKII